jgi:hypothetical protein
MEFLKNDGIYFHAESKQKEIMKRQAKKCGSLSYWTLTTGIYG